MILLKVLLPANEFNKMTKAYVLPMPGLNVELTYIKRKTSQDHCHALAGVPTAKPIPQLKPTPFPITHMTKNKVH